MLTATTTQVLRWPADPATLAAARGHVILDMSAAGTLDHDGLALLVRTRRHLRRDGGHLCLVAPSRLVLTVLHTMRLDLAFPAFPDVPAAHAWLATGVPATDPILLWATV